MIHVGFRMEGSECMNRQKIIRLSAAALILLSSINILSGCGKRRSPVQTDQTLSEPPTVTEQDKAPESSAAEPAQAGEQGRRHGDSS